MGSGNSRVAASGIISFAIAGALLLLCIPDVARKADYEGRILLLTGSRFGG